MREEFKVLAALRSFSLSLYNSGSTNIGLHLTGDENAKEKESFGETEKKGKS